MNGKAATIVIPILTPSLNELLRTHRNERRKLKNMLKARILAAIYDMQMEVRKMRKPSKRIVAITSYRKRRMDPDNFTGGLKQLIDSIKELGLIWDDSPKWLDLRTEQRLDFHEQRTEIYIEVVE